MLLIASPSQNYKTVYKIYLCLNNKVKACIIVQWSVLMLFYVTLYFYWLRHTHSLIESDSDLYVVQLICTTSTSTRLSVWCLEHSWLFVYSYTYMWPFLFTFVLWPLINKRNWILMFCIGHWMQIYHQPWVFILVILVVLYVECSLQRLVFTVNSTDTWCLQPRGFQHSWSPGSFSPSASKSSKDWIKWVLTHHCD